MLEYDIQRFRGALALVYYDGGGKRHRYARLPHSPSSFGSATMRWHCCANVNRRVHRRRLEAAFMRIPVFAR